MQNSNFKRLIAVVLTVVMMLTAIPFSSVAADETAPAAPEYIVFGAYSSNPLVWQVLKTNTDGSLVLITKDLVDKTKFGAAVANKDYATALVFTDTLPAFYNAAFSADEQAAIIETTKSYTNTSGTATATGKVHIPSTAEFNEFGLGAVLTTVAGTTLTSNNAKYWLTDLNGTAMSIVQGSGVIGKVGANQNQYYRAMVTIKAANVIDLPAVDGVTFTATNGAAITKAFKGTSFKVVADETNYDAANLVVKANDTALEAVEGVYTASASPITVEGVVAKPADYTAYDAAKAAAAELDKEYYTADSWAALEAALAVDVTGLTVFDQAKVDDAAAAITAAIAALADAPADFTEYDVAIEQANYMLKNTAIYDLTDIVPDSNYQSRENLLRAARRDETKIRAYLKKDQDKVDAETAKINDLIAGAKIKPALITAWEKAVAVKADLNKEYYEADYVDAVFAIIDEVVKERDFRVDNVLITEQAYVDAQTKRMTDVIGDKNEHLIPADFSALHAALELANTYEKSNYYMDEDEDTHEKELGGTAAWALLEGALVEATRVAASDKLNDADPDNDKEQPTKMGLQEDIDKVTEDLVKAMEGVDIYVRLGKWDRFVKDTKYFFADVKYTIEGIIALLKTVFGLLKMVFNGEISLYDALKDFGVDQEILDIVEKLGFKPTPPAPEEPEEEEPAAPVA